MNRLTVLLLAGALTLFAAACTEDAPDPAPCGEGEMIKLDGSLTCVFPSNLIIEGFLCPQAAPNRHDFQDETVCSEDTPLEQAVIDEMKARGYGAEPIPPASPGEMCSTPGATVDAADGCNTCTCNGEAWGCTKIACSNNDMTCTEGDTMPAGDGCNTCSCGADGTWACTLRGCLAEPGGACNEEGSTSPAADGCNTCTCDGETWACTEIGCDDTCTEGETRFAEDGCNICTCTADGQWACTQTGCYNCRSIEEEGLCVDSGQCTWTTCPSDGPSCPSATDAFCSQHAAPGEDCDIDNPDIQVDAVDGCNTCYCDNGGWSCTEINCGN